MHFTHYQITAGKVFAVNPFKFDDIPHDIDDEQDCLKAQNYRIGKADFETWQSTQPPITADPSIKDGMYKVDDLEIVWQYKSSRDFNWHEVPKVWIEHHEPIEEYLSSYYDETRQYATLKQPVKQEEKEVKTYTEAEYNELKRLFGNQTKHNQSIKQYWLSCAESKNKWVEAIKEHFDGDHAEIKTFDDFKYQFDLD